MAYVICQLHTSRWLLKQEKIKLEMLVGPSDVSYKTFEDV